ncbi:MAG: transcriptional repressor LexA [Lachnospiraceae bacterium]|nr:transcriptional repressor LexA [Lachnospiraceae bacterium]
MANDKLTAKQQRVYEYLTEFTHRNGYAPSVREICEDLELKSTATVAGHLETLEKKGYIRRGTGKNRAIEIVSDRDLRSDIVHIPLIGRVAAGLPILAEQNIEGYFSVNSDALPRGGTLFMLKVRGDSMVNIGIRNGDQVIVSSTPTAENGDVVVALIENEATVKTFYKEKGRYRLQPENDTMEPIIVKDCKILGKVVGLFRIF